MSSDDDTGPKCPYCDADAGDRPCEHLLAWIDLSFQSMEDGGGMAEDLFHRFVREEEALRNDPPVNHASDLGRFDLFKAACEKVATTTLAFESPGGPGMSSAERIYWSDRPPECLESLREEIGLEKL